MIRYNLADIARRAGKRRNYKLPAIHSRRGTEHQYNVVLNKMLAALATYVKTAILPNYQPVRLTRDADENDFEALRRLSVALAQSATDVVNRILSLEAKRHTEQFNNIAKSTLGVDLSTVVAQDDLDEYLRNAAARNAGLIKSLGADTVKEVERIVLQNQINGGTATNVQKQLIERFGVAKSRAKLIATDQTVKLSSELNAIRQQQGGVKTYEWSTSHDERVRPLHRGLDGNIYEWGKSTGAEGGAPPGMPVRCRCVALAIVDIESKYGVRNTRLPTTMRTESVTPSPVATVVARRVAKPALKPELNAVGNPAALEKEMEDYIRVEGARTGVEHLWSYDRVTGQKFEKFSGSKKNVTWSTAFDDMLKDNKNNIIAHHNHPSSSSFSIQDLIMLNNRDGLKGLHAHGHNGSTFYAEPGPKLNGKSEKTIENFLESNDRTIYSIVQSLINERKITKIDDAVKMHSHLTMILNEKRGFISNYKFTLKGETESAIIDNQDVVDSILVKLDDLLKGLKE